VRPSDYNEAIRNETSESDRDDRPSSPVSEAFLQIDETIENFERTLKRLEDRLAFLVNSHPIKGGGDGDTMANPETSGDSPLVSKLNYVRSDMNRLKDRIHVLLDTLDI